MLVGFELAYYQFGALTIDAQLHAVSRADADVFDQLEYVGVPARSSAHVRHGKYRDDARPWGRAVLDHASRSHMRGLVTQGSRHAAGAGPGPTASSVQSPPAWNCLFATVIADIAFGQPV